MYTALSANVENVIIGSNSVLLLDAVLVVGFDRVVVWVPAGECGNGRGVGDGAARIHCNVKLYYGYPTNL